jgi:hypothetical protein
MAEIIRSATVKTRKDHVCFGCQCKIPEGSTVTAETCTNIGSIYTLYFCEECWEFLCEHEDLCEDDDGMVWEGYIGDARSEFERTEAAQ